MNCTSVYLFKVMSTELRALQDGAHQSLFQVPSVKTDKNTHSDLTSAKS